MFGEDEYLRKLSEIHILETSTCSGALETAVIVSGVEKFLRNLFEIHISEASTCARDLLLCLGHQTVRGNQEVPGDFRYFYMQVREAGRCLAGCMDV